ncbi:glucose-1-phosphate adenylyltransferase [Arthrobacter subterraneus]|uniref:Glucose-1-phosphate adenylyltransferase n=2 Tax=Arthrobacter TaxID=1663 RepID=A0A1G8DI22_9MICC|nr:sugar phosphate nucleotidyltransferase [Arthrobacter subterraneus]SDH56990.1 glucose-1-phosphate adenylyltransferase [Arthrobacter subterraneus]
MTEPSILAVILAGGTGGRLGALTDSKAKPVVPVGGTYRLIDIPLSNLHHSHISDVWVVEQYQPKSINDHLANGRPWDLDRTNGGLRVLPPFQGEHGAGFAAGNADGLYRQAEFIREFDPELVLVLSADHLYRLDYRDVVSTHRKAGAALTMVTVEYDGDASQHGVVESERGLVTGFQYKPEDPRSSVVAAEIFLYSTDVLLDTLAYLHERDGELQDYGDQLIPHLVENGTVADHRLDSYWLDLGTPENYHRAHMDLLSGAGLAFDDPAWPILSASPRRLPAFVADSARVASSLLSPGARIAGAVTNSVIGPDVVVEEGAVVEHSVVLDRARIPAGAVLRSVIVDADAQLDPGAAIGEAGSVTVVDANGKATHPSG